jgi:hypothetical protein
VQEPSFQVVFGVIETRALDGAVFRIVGALGSAVRARPVHRGVFPASGVDQDEVDLAFPINDAECGSGAPELGCARQVHGDSAVSKLDAHWWQLLSRAAQGRDAGYRQRSHQKVAPVYFGFTYLISTHVPIIAWPALFVRAGV